MKAKVDNTQLNEKQIQEISDFVVRKREQIMMVLWSESELIQSELAKKVGSTVTSLSNILLRFDNFKYKLLEYDNRGVRKYISLSNIGILYMQFLNSEDTSSTNEKIIPSNHAYLLQEARNQIMYFREKAAEGTADDTDDDTELLMENALLCLYYGIANESTDGDVDALLKYIYCLEKLIFSESDVYYAKVIELIQSDILKKRIEQFLEGFYLFLPILQILEDKNNILQIYSLIENIAKGNIQEASDTVKEKNWDVDCIKLLDYFKKITSSRKRSKEDIYKILCGCLPDKMELAAMLTQIIHVDA